MLITECQSCSKMKNCRKHDVIGLWNLPLARWCNVNVVSWQFGTTYARGLRWPRGCPSNNNSISRLMHAQPLKWHKLQVVRLRERFIDSYRFYLFDWRLRPHPRVFHLHNGNQRCGGRKTGIVRPGGIHDHPRATACIRSARKPAKRFFLLCYLITLWSYTSHSRQRVFHGTGHKGRVDLKIGELQPIYLDFLTVGILVTL